MDTVNLYESTYVLRFVLNESNRSSCEAGFLSTQCGNI